jgi:nicotinamidase-related amidase
MKIALLIIDVQQSFVGHQQNTPFYENTIAYVNAAASMFRQFKHVETITLLSLKTA